MAVELPMLKALSIDATGQDFAMMSGEWLENERVAAFVSRAERAWVFAVRDPSEISTLMEQVADDPGARLVCLLPGAHPEWDASGHEILLRLLGGLPIEDVTVGLLLLMNAGCGGCDKSETNCCAGASYMRNEPQGASGA